MNMDKRYCQNRQRKRKRTIVQSPIESKNVSPSEEERQFKLRRFVEDVGKFLSERESCPDQKIVPKTKTSMKEKRTVKKVTIPDAMVNRGLFRRGGIQTKFCTRGGVLTREMTAKLDENLHQIISLGNQCNHQCQCTHRCEGKFEQQTGLGSLEHGTEPRKTSILRPLQPRAPPSCEDLHPAPSPSTGLVGGERVATSSGGTKNGKSLSELDKELYPLFARVVSVSCTQTKSALFKNRSYVSAVKRKLLQIYVNRVNEDKRQLSYLPESKKATSSIGTSPYPSPVQTQSSYHNIETPFKLAPAKFRFQSTMQFLEETIGPSSSCSSKQMVLSPQHCQSHSHHCQPPVQHSQPHLQHRQPTTSLLSPPVVGYQRHQRVSSYVPKVSKYVHEPFPSSSPAITPLYNLKSKVFDGSGDGFHFNCFNSFLPPIEEEEDSPDFRYYPRKIF